MIDFLVWLAHTHMVTMMVTLNGILFLLFWICLVDQDTNDNDDGAW